MSTTTTSAPLTARVVLFPDDEPGTGTGLAAALSGSAAARPALARVARWPAAALEAVDAELGSVASGLMDIDVGDAVVLGWRKYSALVEAARRTVASPGSEEIVVLATHRISSTHRPSVDVWVDEVKVNTFEFVLSVQIDIRGLSAVVRGGDLVALHGGDGVVSVTLTLEGAPLAQRQRTVDLRVLVPLRHPISLVGGSPATPSDTSHPPAVELPAQRDESSVPDAEEPRRTHRS
jgi:hypothetical protein